MFSARTKSRRDFILAARQGFTLIELLVVIAIIAIIAAILFPVFAKVREKGRQSTVLANFEKLQRGLGEFQLEYHRYPAALYGYAVSGQPMGTKTTSHAAPVGLYPQFINDVGVFQDPDNPTNSDLSTVVSPAVKQLSGGILAPIVPAPSFYKADAYDVNPQMSADGKSLTANYVARYQTSWTDITAPGMPPTGVTAGNYARQLRVPNSPGDTYVTLSTYHVPSGAVLVLWQSGTAKTLDPSRLAALEASSTFWQITPSGQ